MVMTLSSYLYKWKLKFSTMKTMLLAFHLYNKDARREVNIFVNGEALPFSVEPTYLTKKLDRELTFRQHFESLRKKLTSRVRLIKQLAGSSWMRMPRYSAQPPLPWSIPRLSTARPFGVAVLIIVLSTSPLTMPCA